MPSNADYAQMIRHRAGDLARICHNLATGRIDIDQFGELFDGVLLKGHTDGWVMGRQRAGDSRDITDADRLAGLAAKDSEAQFLNGFLDDLRNGRYLDDAGELKEAAIRARSNLYLGKVRATSAEAFVEASDPAEEYIWILVAEEHCEDCPRIADLSPFTKDTIIGFPGSGDTECLGNCKCFLKRVSDNHTTFEAPSLG